MAKPLTVIQKKRFRSLALQPITATGMRPNLASGDYIINTIHDGSQEAIKKSRDLYYGAADRRSAFPQWWSIDLSLSYDDPDPAAPAGSKVHYILHALPACQMTYTVVKRFINRILEAVYEKLGRGLGEVYMSIIPPGRLETYLNDERIIKFPVESGEIANIYFDDWQINFVGDDLHEVDPTTIPQWQKPVQS